MALQYSVAIRNAQLDAVESTIGATAKLYLFTGAAPANCAAADSGTLLATLTLPADWMAAAAAGAKALLGSWAGAGAAAGSAGYFRVKDNAGTVCGMQGTVTATGGGGDLQLDNVSIAVSQAISITSFTLNAANA